MPRVKLNKRKYMVRDLSQFIINQMRAHGMNQTDLGKMCGHPQQTMSYRLKNGELSVEDLIIIFTRFDVSLEVIGSLLKEKE